MQFCAVFNSPREDNDETLDAHKPAKPLVKQRKRGSRKVLVVRPLLALLLVAHWVVLVFSGFFSNL